MTRPQPGADQPHAPWSPIGARGPLVWPGGAPVGLAVIVLLECVEIPAPEAAYETPSLVGGMGRRPSPDLARLSHREYGHRVGVFRLLDALEAAGIPPTVALDATTACTYQFLVRHCLARATEVVAHGLSASRPITSRMSEDVERAYVRRSLDLLREATGRRPAGWLGPEQSESPHTPPILAGHGVRYVCDWVNDERPYPMVDGVWALPVTHELDDLKALVLRGLDPGSYATAIRETVGRLVDEGDGRSVVVVLRPWLSGQPFRIDAVAAALAEVAATEGVWVGACGELVDHARRVRHGARS